MEISQIKSASKRAAINAVTLITDHKEKANNLKSAIWKSAKKVATASEVGILSADLWAIILDHVAEKDSQEIWSIDQFQIYPYELSPGIDLGQNLLNLINETSFKTIKEARIDSHTSCYNSILMAAKDNIKSRLSLFAAQDPQKFGQRLSIQQEVLAKRPEKPLDTNPFDYLDPGQINYFFRSLVTALDDPINKEIKSNLESALDSFVKIAAEKLDPEILNQIQIPRLDK